MAVAEEASESTESPLFRAAGTAKELGSPENAVGELSSVAIGMQLAVVYGE